MHAQEAEGRDSTASTDTAVILQRLSGVLLALHMACANQLARLTDSPE